MRGRKGGSRWVLVRAILRQTQKLGPLDSRQRRGRKLATDPDRHPTVQLLLDTALQV